MATTRRPDYSLRDALYWDETECLNYYGMLSLHEVFEIVGSQLTEVDVEVLSFLLEETFSGRHPLDPADWTVQPCPADPEHKGVAPSPALLSAWRRFQPRGSHCAVPPLRKPKSGLELLLELENRGYLSEGNLEPLLQLLRVLTRHDLLPLVSRKKRRTVSPERIGQTFEPENRGATCPVQPGDPCRQTDAPLTMFSHWRSGTYPPMPGPAPRRRRRKRGYGWSRRPKRADKQGHLPPLLPERVSCVLNRPTCLSGKQYPHTQ